MDGFKVNLLGAGAVKISGEHKIIYLDAFSQWVRTCKVERADLILITHADEDHFCPTETARVALDTGAVVVGPPSIAYPLLADERLPAEQLEIIYPVHFKQPVTREVQGVKLKVYQTRHFVDWEPIHVSYVVELARRRLYITGDSSMMDEDDPDLQGLDGILYSLVPKDLSDPLVMANHLTEIALIQERFHPRYLIPNHLVQCEWTVAPLDFKRATEDKGLEGIVVIENEKHGFEIA